jgi:hypothetical protein
MADKADLHIHTTCSDGKLKPEEVILLAQQKKLKAVSITDHDTFEGYWEAKPLADELGIELVPGVEVTTTFNGREAHILAYYFDPDTQYFAEFLNTQTRARKNRIKGIVKTLQDQKVDIEYQEVWAEADGANLGRPHIAKVLIEKGYVSNVAEAFKRYLSNQQLGEIISAYPTAEEAIDIIKKVGGAAILAHPGRMYSKAEVNTFIELGIDGLECIHPSHNWKKQLEYTELCDKQSLLKTGGSDYHGPFEGGYTNVGVVTIAKKYLDSLKRMTELRKQTIEIED